MHYSSTLTTYLSTARWTFSTCFMCLPFGELEETTRTPSYYVDEDYPAGPKSNNLSLNEVLIMAQNRPLWRLMSTFGAAHC